METSLAFQAPPSLPAPSPSQSALSIGPVFTRWKKMAHRGVPIGAILHEIHSFGLPEHLREEALRYFKDLTRRQSLEHGGSTSPAQVDHQQIQPSSTLVSEMSSLPRENSSGPFERPQRMVDTGAPRVAPGERKEEFSLSHIDPSPSENLAHPPEVPAFLASDRKFQRITRLASLGVPLSALHHEVNITGWSGHWKTIAHRYFAGRFSPTVPAPPQVRRANVGISISRSSSTHNEEKKEDAVPPGAANSSELPASLANDPSFQRIVRLISVGVPYSALLHEVEATNWSERWKALVRQHIDSRHTRPLPSPPQARRVGVAPSSSSRALPLPPLPPPPPTLPPQLPLPPVPPAPGYSAPTIPAAPRATESKGEETSSPIVEDGTSQLWWQRPEYLRFRNLLGAGAPDDAVRARMLFRGYTSAQADEFIGAYREVKGYGELRQRGGQLYYTAGSRRRTKEEAQYFLDEDLDEETRITSGRSTLPVQGVKTSPITTPQCAPSIEDWVLQLGSSDPVGSSLHSPVKSIGYSWKDIGIFGLYESPGNLRPSVRRQLSKWVHLPEEDLLLALEQMESLIATACINYRNSTCIFLHDDSLERHHRQLLKSELILRGKELLGKNRSAWSRRVASKYGAILKLLTGEVLSTMKG